MEGFFNPKNVVIVGASTNVGSPGWAMARTALNTFKRGPVYFVNPKGGKLFEQTCYKSIADLPSEQIDLALIAISARFVCDSVEQLAKLKNCHYQVVLAGGFAEVDEAGAGYQRRLKELTVQYGIRVIGPNCLGIYSPGQGIDCLFIEGDLAARPNSGHISFATQSGGFGTCMFNELSVFGPHNEWFGRLVSVGNSCDVCEADFMQFFETDPDTHVSTFYLEGFKESKRFFESARRSVVAGKPVLVCKSGRTSAGMSATRSHSAALAADDAVADSLMKQYGILRCDGWKDMFQLYAPAFICGQRIYGDRVQILTNGGGQGVQIADAIDENGLKLASIPQDIHDQLKAKFKPFYIIANPLDLTGSGTNEEFIHTFKVLGNSDSSDVLILNLVTYLSQIDPDLILKEMIAVFGKHVPNRKPLFVCVMGSTKPIKDKWMKECFDAGIPVYDSEVEIARAVAKVYQFTKYQQKELAAIEAEKTAPPPAALPESAKKCAAEILSATQAKLNDGEEKALLEHEAYTLLKEAGLPVPHFALAHKAEDAEAFLNEQFPDPARRAAARFVVKIVSPDILHKSDVGGVEVNISPEGGALADAVDRMMKKFTAMQIPTVSPTGEKTTRPCNVQGILITEMVPSRASVDSPREKGVELIVGMNTDSTFGKVLLVGLGGVLVEVLKDVTFGTCPLIKRDALDMLDRLKSQKMLNGYRDLPPVDRSKLADLMVRVSQLAAECPAIRSIDFNPVIAGRSDLWIVDARIMVGK